MKFTRSFFVFVFIFSSQFVAFAAEDIWLSIDLDETLIASDKLIDSRVREAKELGYEVLVTEEGQEYVVRPGAIDLLKYAQAQGFKLLLFTQNTRDYALDILNDSGLWSYFADIKSNEDLRSKSNRDYKKYPHHRNLYYPQDSWLKAHTIGLYRGYVKRGAQRLIGNSNIHPYVPCTECLKYPPMYGARVHIDNSERHTDRPLDYVGINVVDFDADKIEAKNSNGDYLWVEELKPQLDFLKEYGWEKLYWQNYKRAPAMF